MLTFDEKLKIIEAFPELEKKTVSLGRVNFQLQNSISEKKNIVYHLHPNGNGFIYAGHLNGYATDAKGMVNIRDYSADELQKLIKEAIRKLSPEKLSIEDQAVIGELPEERWVNGENNKLIVLYENEAWNIYYGLNLDASFDTYKEAEEYLIEEGFHKDQ